MRWMKMVLYITISVGVSCDKLSHLVGMPFVSDEGGDPNVGFVVGFDTREVVDVDFETLNLLFFDEGERLVRSYLYTDMERVALTKFTLESGAYTIVALFNGEETIEIPSSDQTLYFAEVVDMISDLHDLSSSTLSGMAQGSIEGGTTQIIIPITREPMMSLLTQYTLCLVHPTTSIQTLVRSQTPLRRSIVEIYKSGVESYLLRKESTSERLEFNLMDGDYELLIWSDYTFDESVDLYYNTSNTRSITISGAETYTANSDYKDAFAATHTISIGSGSGEVTDSVNLSRPSAKYSVVATDVEGYLNMAESMGYPPIEDLRVRVIYDGFFPTSYDIATSTLVGSKSGYEYDGSVGEVESSGVTIASDYIFVNGEESSVTISVVVSDEEGSVISSLSGSVVPYVRGYHTVLSGNFLTANLGGIYVERSWAEDFNVVF